MLTRDINVNLSSGKVDDFGSLQELLFLKEELESNLAQLAYDKIRNSAEILLVDSKDPYLKGLSVYRNTVQLYTIDFLVHLVEEGEAPFDMKKGFLSSNKVKTGKDGQKYIVIPLQKYRGGLYNWRDKNTGRFQKSNTSGSVEFRIVSENSDPSSWIHPGHLGYHLMDRVIEDLDMSKEIDEFIAKAF